MMLRLQMALALTCGMLAGCGQVSVFGRTIGEKSPEPEVKTEAAVTATAPVTPQVYIVKSVTLALTPQASAKVESDARFNADTLLAAIKSELTSRKLFDESDARASGTVEISLEDYAMRPTSNAIVFGNIISSGLLSGTLRLRDAHGSDVLNRPIQAEARVSVPATGETPNPLAPLYRQFAESTAHTLAGTKAKPAIGADQHPRE